MSKRPHFQPPNPPSLDHLPLVNASEDVAHWLDHYWRKLGLPTAEAGRLGVTDSRAEFARWTGRRLNPLALGCYCYLPDATNGSSAVSMENETTRATLTAPAAAPSRLQLTLPGFASEMETLPPDLPIEPSAPPATDYRHLIFVEPDLLPLGIEVTVAHELIHLSDRVQGNPRRHRCHGYDSISVDEAAITERDPELLRSLLREETTRREDSLRQLRPYRFVYACPNCGKEYLRVRRYARPVSCGRCDKHYNPAFLLELRATLDAPPAEG
ncbi:MAG TPA: hypothetical protein VJN88_10595 [Ktedonobacterales bacterium]|nr:hypothetical protein [Ktedonobacterales bacterium]